MGTNLLQTKLYIPAPRPASVARPRLLARLNAGLMADCKLILISAPAGFGKTTLVGSWVAEFRNRVAWLSLDEGDSDLIRFLTYLVAALQTVVADIGSGVLAALQSPQPPSAESLLTTLLNEIAAVPDPFILVLDDYHVIESEPVRAPMSVDDALAFLLEHLPSQMHVVITTREDPQLPLARLRARGQLAELRAADLRFTPAEAAEFLGRVMGLNLSAEEIAALETRTEGWVAGLQLAALSMQGRSDTADFIQTFTGSHRFVLDYLVEEVLRRQPAAIQTFLLRTSILDRLCGPLCAAVLGKDAGSKIPDMKAPAPCVLPPASCLLEFLERANLFIVPLDDERRWYRYHHLFGGFLRQRLEQSLAPDEIAGLHVRASAWYENNGLVFESFRHAVAAHDVARAERLVELGTMPTHFRSVAMAILDWLASLPEAVMDDRPSLWVKSATLALVAGQTAGVEERLQAAEKALQNTALDARSRDLIGQIACARATLALTRYDPETMIVQAHRALEYLHPADLTFLFTANWALASAYMFQGDRAAAAQACMESLSISRKSGDMFSTILATSDLGHIQQLDNRLHQAAETYRRVLQLAGEYPQPNIAEIQLGLAHIFYEWNDLDAAEYHGQESLQLARQYDRVIDRFIISEVFLARVKLARGDVAGAAALLAQTEQSARRENFVRRLPEIAAAQALVLLHQGDVAAAARLVQKYKLPLDQARVLLSQGDASAALALLSVLRQEMEARGWQDERLKVMVLQAVALHAHGENATALQVLEEALALAAPGGFIRLFVDEGPPMAALLSEVAAHGIAADYAATLLATFPDASIPSGQSKIRNPKLGVSEANPPKIVEPLSPRELEVLHLIAQGLSNREIAARLFLALSTVKGHNREIFDKLQVQRRTEAVARARELGLL
ncbi:MAG: AAA family ATPase [Anaerolineae bacterium]|nr:AAA family ATPase [Anaerolineae bacterium]